MKPFLFALLVACGGAEPATTSQPKTAETIACGDNKHCPAAQFCVHVTSSGHGQPPPAGRAPSPDDEIFECQASAPTHWQDTGIACELHEAHQVVCTSPLAPAAPH